MGCKKINTNFLEVVFRKNGQRQKKNALDYFSGGMQMPNRNVQGDYRYNYQGQELDPETGKVAFQLRLYDSRINRWLTTDPAGQYHSPYLAMGNNPISSIDPDGGYDNWFQALGAWIGGGFQGKIDHAGGGGDREWAISSIKEGTGDLAFTVARDYGATKYINIFRDVQTDFSTTSMFTFGGVNGFMLEPAGPDTTIANRDRRIPEGIYNLRNHNGDRYQDVFKLSNDQVPESRAILIHNGSYPVNTEGCLLPGCYRSKDFVNGSKKKLIELNTAINAVGVENTRVIIHNNFPHRGIPFLN